MTLMKLFELYKKECVTIANSDVIYSSTMRQRKQPGGVTLLRLQILRFVLGANEGGFMTADDVYLAKYRRGSV
jgi:hypothetical protein